MKHYDPGNPKPEFVIGLAGPIGTDLRGVSSKLAGELTPYRYQVSEIRISEIIQQICSSPVIREIAELTEELRIDSLMNAGDFLRCEIADGAAVLPAVIEEIRRKRQEFLLKEGCDDEFESVELYNRCFILNSLKHPDEVRVLREIYGRKFVLISVVTPQEVRKRNLISKITKSHNSTEEKKFYDVADKLIEKDRQRTDASFGQSIGETFPLADFFIRGDIHLEFDVTRTLRLLFGDQRETPTRLEFAMYEAKSNAYRSADLARQVGAVITSSDLEIIARGCNEVPSPGGGVFWADDRGVRRDNRDISVGRDFNSVKKVEILTELLSFMNEKKIAEFGNKDIEETVNQLVFDEYKTDFKHLRISNLVEFGRMVHAEMAALMEAARRGFSVEDGKLICTTFPCHMCARHIIAAGIREVFFIEPYPKSMTAEIYKDEIEIESDADIGTETKPGKVYFRSFYGVAPRFFAAAFEMRPRKDDRGYALPFDAIKAVPPMIPLSRGHVAVELVFGQTLNLLPKINDFTKIKSDLK